MIPSELPDAPTPLHDYFCLRLTSLKEFVSVDVREGVVGGSERVM